MLEYDIFKLMQKGDISEIFDFFDVSISEENDEIMSGQQNLFCNFESTLIHELVPTIWNLTGLRIPMNSFRDPLNQMEEIVYRLYNMAEEFGEGDDKVEVRHKFVDF